jgi:hypothetical protein
MRPLPEYESKGSAEAAWFSIITPMGGLAGMIVNRMTGDADMALLVGVIVVGAARGVMGHFLPSPPLPEP